MSTLTLEPQLVGGQFGRASTTGAQRSSYRSGTQRDITSSSGALQLTRRGRLLVVITALVIAFVVGIFVAAAGSAASERPGTPAPTRIVQVHEGDTLWDVASSVAVGGDVRASMAEIEQLNAMRAGDLRVGQRLVVPAR